MTNWMQDYQDNGAALVRRVLEVDWIDKMCTSIQDVLDNVGDDARYDTRPGTFMGNPKLKLEDGDKISGELFPRFGVAPECI